MEEKKRRPRIQKPNQEFPLQERNQSEDSSDANDRQEFNEEKKDEQSREKPEGERKNWEENRPFDRERKPWQDRNQGSGGGGGYERKPWQDRSQGGGGGGGYERKPWQDRNQGGGGGGGYERKPWQDRNQGGGGGGGYERKPWQDRSQGGGGGYERKPWQDRNQGSGGGGGYERKPWQDRSQGSGGGGGYERKPWQDRNQGSGGGGYERKPWQDRSQGSGGGGGYERKPWQDRSQGGGGGYERKPWQDRNQGSGGGGYERKPYNKDGGGFGKKPFGRKPFAKRDEFFVERKPKPELPSGEDMPLNKYLAHCGIASRRKAVEFIEKGLVSVNGEVKMEPYYRVQKEDVVMCDGQPVKIQERKVYLLLNKPKGIITTTDDDRGRPTVLDIVDPHYPERLYPVGRLDRDTTGLLLITNDGDLAAKLTHPSHQIQKQYRVGIDRPLSKADFERIEKGVELEDGVVHVNWVRYSEEQPNLDVIELEIVEGRNRVVRRLFEALGYNVRKLDRFYFAGLTKRELPRGSFRELTQREIVMLKHFTGHPSTGKKREEDDANETDAGSDTAAIEDDES
ncbi:MAG: rRNA pseudouridine synthase [Saprospirales bacterium]|nr:rRNA pseudouridine synthase [Saprospirales bacterium]MBK8921704.1 rRNA pseudouridine synthase [Saprospirales bacterium]